MENAIAKNSMYSLTELRGELSDGLATTMIGNRTIEFLRSSDAADRKKTIYNHRILRTAILEQ
jgi:hypothetical protein